MKTLIYSPDKNGSSSSDTTVKAILANTDYSLYHELLGENVTEEKRLLQNTFQIQSCNKYTRS